MIQIGNAPCSWGVEFADDPRNPAWRKVLKENAEAGFKGIELGPVGFMPEDPVVLSEALDEFGQTLIGGVVFRPFHDPDLWDEVMHGAVRTCQALDVTTVLISAAVHAASMFFDPAEKFSIAGTRP